MDVLFQVISLYALKPGDHIYSWRTLCIYAHHGIYDGEGKVIHFTSAGPQSSSSSSSSSHASVDPCPQCGYHSGLGGVISSCLFCFLNGGFLFRFEYGVSPAFFATRIRRTCTLTSSDPPEDVLHRARYLLNNGFGRYDLFEKNCESFAFYCKTGRIVIPRETTSSLRVAEGVLVSSPLYVLANFNPVLLLTAHSNFALQFDIGLRPDAVEVPVEELYKFLSG